MWNLDWTRRDKSNILLVPAEKFANQASLGRAAFPSSKIIDWREEFLRSVRPNQKRLSLAVESEIKRLTAIGNSDKRIFTVINTEYLLAGINEESKEQFWLALRNDFPHLEGILIFTVLASKEFLPDKLTLAAWKKAGRLFDMSDT
jgi:hypothetical protein